MSVHVLVWERGTLVSLDHKCSWGSFWINFIRFVWKGRLHFFREIKDPIGPKRILPLPNRRGSQSGPLNRNDPSAMQRIHHGIRKGSASWTETIPRRCSASTMESEKVQPQEYPRERNSSGLVRWGACYHSLYFLGRHSQVKIFKRNHKKLDSLPIPHHQRKREGTRIASIWRGSKVILKSQNFSKKSAFTNKSHKKHDKKEILTIFPRWSMMSPTRHTSRKSHTQIKNKLVIRSM